MTSRILVVDDEPYIVEEIIEALVAEDYDCEGVNNVDDALRLIREDSLIRLVITDLKMPGKSGLQLIQQVGETIPREVDFIVVSGHSPIGADPEDVQALAEYFLHKPLDINELMQAVKCIAERWAKSPDI